MENVLGTPREMDSCVATDVCCRGRDRNTTLAKTSLTRSLSTIGDIKPFRPALRRYESEEPSAKTVVLHPPLPFSLGESGSVPLSIRGVCEGEQDQRTDHRTDQRTDQRKVCELFYVFCINFGTIHLERMDI